ncbi:MAG: DUF3140 domain-containing protein [Deltaproteobacteria bacterium]|nr:DUF3140 domain-containing protein [Deltaproteobacteria bacterium]
MREVGVPMSDGERRAIRRAYHEVSNLTVGELQAHRDGHATPMRGNATAAEHEMCDRLVEIQHKREGDLTDEDHEVMARAVSRIHLLLRQRPEGPVRCSSWRRRLLLLGHDPLNTERDRRFGSGH